jgi:hypothetical protein
MDQAVDWRPWRAGQAVAEHGVDGQVGLADEIVGRVSDAHGHDNLVLSAGNGREAPGIARDLNLDVRSRVG